VVHVFGVAVDCILNFNWCVGCCAISAVIHHTDSAVAENGGGLRVLLGLRVQSHDAFGGFEGEEEDGVVDGGARGELGDDKR